MRQTLTAEDKAWLEHHLSEAVVPVMPRPEFIHDAKLALFNGSIHDVEQSELAPALPALLFGLALMVFAIYRLRQRARQR